MSYRAQPSKIRFLVLLLAWIAKTGELVNQMAGQNIQQTSCVQFDKSETVEATQEITCKEPHFILHFQSSTQEQSSDSPGYILYDNYENVAA